jgi:dienelactone hydrolase
MRPERFSIALTALLISIACTPANASTGSTCSEVTLQTADHFDLAAMLCVPPGSGPFPAVVDLRPRRCEGYAGIPPAWEQTALPSWGYALLEIDSFAARGVSPGKCEDLDAVTSRQLIGDAYSGLQYLVHDSRIDRRHIGLLAFMGGVATAAIFAATQEARQTFLSNYSPAFRASFAFYPYCNVEFTDASPNFYAPVRIFTGEKDDMEPADRCVILLRSLRGHDADADLQAIVYPGAQAGFDLTPLDTNYPSPDRTALHPGGVTVSTHPQYSPWGRNFSACTMRLLSIFDPIEPAQVESCMRRGIHFQGDAESAERARADLQDQLRVLVGE